MRTHYHPPPGFGFSSVPLCTTVVTTSSESLTGDRKRQRMASSPVPQSGSKPPPLHSPHSPYGKNRPSAFGSNFEDYEETCTRRAQQQQQHQPVSPPQSQPLQQKTHQQAPPTPLPQPMQCGPRGFDSDRADVDVPAVARRGGVNGSQPSTPCEGVAPGVLGRVKAAPHTGLATPPSCAPKDVRLACRQQFEETYTPACISDGGAESERPQKKELRLEDAHPTATLQAYRSVFSPASALSATTTLSLDTACTGGRDSSVFSFTSSVRNTFESLGATSCRLPLGMTPTMTLAGDVSAATPILACPIPPRNPSIPIPPSPAVSTAARSMGERSTASTMEGPALSSCSCTPPPLPPSSSSTACAPSSSGTSLRLSKMKKRLQNLNAPAFDLKAVQEAQRTFLEEEVVCNAAQCHPMTDINTLLSVGTWKDASDPALLKKHDIRYVLNVAKELVPVEEAEMIAQNKDIISESIPMSDSHSQDVAEHLLKAFRFIERARADNSRVLVHCRRGISRSAAIAVAYLMASGHRTYEDALRYVTERRSCVSLNLAFQERLSEFVPTCEFFHGLPTSPISPAPPTATPTAGGGGGCASSCGGLLPSLPSVPLTRTGSTHSTTAACQRPHPPSRLDTLMPRPRECQSVSSSTASSRASSGVHTAPSRSIAPLCSPHQEANKRHMRLSLAARHAVASGSSHSTATPTPTTATASVKSSESTWLEEAAITPARGSHAPGSRQQSLSRRASALPRPAGGLQLPSQPSTTLTTASSTSPGLRLGTSEDTPTATPQRDSDGDGDGDDEEDGNEDGVEEPGSPFGSGARRPFAHFSFAQTSSSSASCGSRRPLGRHRSFSEEEDARPAPLTATVTTTLPPCDEGGAVAAGLGTASLHRVSGTSSSSFVQRSQHASSDAMPVVVTHTHEHHSPRTPVPGGSAFDDVSDDDGDDGGVPEPAPAVEILAVHKPAFRNPRFRKAFSAPPLGSSAAGSGAVSGAANTGAGGAGAGTGAGPTGVPPSPSEPAGGAQNTYRAMQLRSPAVDQGSHGESRTDSPRNGSNSSSTATGGGNTLGTAMTFAGLSATRYGTQSSLNEEGAAPTSPTVPHTASIVVGALSRGSSTSVGADRAEG